MRIFRRPGPPREVLAALKLDRKEYVIAWASAADGSHVVATDRALRATGPLGGVRLEWHEIAEATWREGVLRVVEERSTQGSRPRMHTWLFDRPGLLPDAVRDRVTTSIVVNQHVRLIGRSGVRIIGRRVPGSDELAWTLRFDAAFDASDPQVRAMAEAELADLRRQLGA